MEKVYAEFNHGRWVAICPRCLAQGVLSAMEVQAGQVFVCPEENPNLLAKTLVPNPRMQGAFNAVPDKVLREEAYQSAIQAGLAYEVVFPAEQKEIERELRIRPRPAQNWWVGTTVEELKNENSARGVRHA